MRNHLDKASIQMAGEQGMVVDFGNEISAGINECARRLSQVLIARAVAGITEVVPTYRSVMIYFDPILLPRPDLLAIVKEALLELKDDEGVPTVRRVIRVPVCYGGVFGPDMEYVARRTRLSVEDVIATHTTEPYLIYMLGFTPGFPYLGGLPDSLVVPRTEKSRMKIPEGSVGIAGRQTGFYTVESTGGWRIIGRTPLKAFLPDHPDPFLFAAGDYLQFKAVSVDEFFEIRRAVEGGTYCPEICDAS